MGLGGKFGHFLEQLGQVVGKRLRAQNFIGALVGKPGGYKLPKLTA